MTSPADCLFDQVVTLLEPLTRFDRTSLVRGGGKQGPVAAQAAWRFEVGFIVDSNESAGPLPPDVRVVSGAADLDERDAERIAQRSADLWVANSQFSR